LTSKSKLLRGIKLPVIEHKAKLPQVLIQLMLKYGQKSSSLNDIPIYPTCPSGIQESFSTPKFIEGLSIKI